MPDLTQVTEDSFAAEVLEAPTPVLVDFYADWCGPCRAMEPALKDVADEYADDIRVVKLNVDKHPAVSERYEVSGIPALLLFKEGQLVDRITGAVARSKIAAAIEKLVAPSA
jgi:thioredoxin 1